MSNLASRDKFRSSYTAIRMAMRLLVISMFATVLLSSCESEQKNRQPRFISEYGALPRTPEKPITSRWWFKPLAIGCIGAVIAMFRGNSGTPGNTTQPTQPKPPAQPPRTTTPTACTPPQTPSGAIWFYREGGQEFGPFTQDALTQLVACNVIARTTEIRRQGGAWVTYTDVFGV